MNIFRITYRRLLSFLPEKLSLNIDYFRGYKKFINFKNPKYFGEKIQCMKIYNNMEKYTNYVDKVKVRSYIKETIGDEYLIPLLGVYNNANEIDFDKLPNSFVIKANHGCGYNLIVKNKKNININKTKKKINKWLKEDFSKIRKEYQYKNVERKLLCEKCLINESEELVDYKFFCFNGKVEFLKVDFDRHNNHKANYYSLDKSLLDLKEGKYNNYQGEFSFPSNFNSMIEIAKKLCRPFDFVRVDLYNLKGKIYFGELTFTPTSGANPFYPLSKDTEIAKKINYKKQQQVMYLGSVGEKSGRLDGVTIKSKCLLEYLKDSNIVLKYIDVDNYKKRFISIIYKFILYYKKSSSIVICSSSHGASIVLRFLYYIKCKKDIYYFVCGGILDQWIKNNKYNVNWYKNIKKIYVESNEMKDSFLELDLKQTSKLDNFRKPNVKFTSVSDNNSIKFVFFGRVVEKKGVEDAIRLIKDLRKNSIDVSLDIFGQATEEYKKRIDELIDNKYINYKGPIIPNNYKEYEMLHNYDIFILPTKYYNEGLPGGLIDAYISGLAVIASEWKYSFEYIENNKNGIIYKFNQYDDLYNKTKKIMKKNIIQSYKKYSLELSKKYLCDFVLKDFKEKIEK